jgi:GntR family transcriptional regulator
MSERTGYAEIAAHFRRAITDGEMPPGTVLPSLRDVCKEFAVSMTTANRAFRQLRAERLTVSKPGVGTIVAREMRTTSTGVARIGRLQRTNREFAPGETSTGHSAELASIRDLDICEQLELEPGDEVVVRRRVFRRDGVPTVVALSFINIRVRASVPEVLQQGQLKPFWQTTYRERTGREISRSPERRSARLASDDELSALEVTVPQWAAVPVLVLHTTFHDEEGPIEVWEDVHAPGLWQVAAE